MNAAARIDKPTDSAKRQLLRVAGAPINLANLLWADQVYWARRPFQTPAAKRATHAAVKKLAASRELVAALDAVYRLDGRTAAATWIGKLGAPAPKPPSTAEERRARTAKLITQRAAHAREKLAEAEAKLRRAERLVKKWTDKVRYYESRGY